jgi:hypothetical protein
MLWTAPVTGIAMSGFGYKPTSQPCPMHVRFAASFGHSGSDAPELPKTMDRLELSAARASSGWFEKPRFSAGQWPGSLTSFPAFPSVTT